MRVPAAGGVGGDDDDDAAAAAVAAVAAAAAPARTASSLAMAGRLLRLLPPPDMSWRKKLPVLCWSGWWLGEPAPCVALGGCAGRACDQSERRRSMEQCDVRHSSCMWLLPGGGAASSHFACSDASRQRRAHASAATKLGPVAAQLWCCLRPVTPSNHRSPPTSARLAVDAARLAAASRAAERRSGPTPLADHRRGGERRKKWEPNAAAPISGIVLQVVKQETECCGGQA